MFNNYSTVVAFFTKVIIPTCYSHLCCDILLCYIVYVAYVYN